MRHLEQFSYAVPLTTSASYNPNSLFFSTVMANEGRRSGRSENTERVCIITCTGSANDAGGTVPPLFELNENGEAHRFVGDAKRTMTSQGYFREGSVWLSTDT